MEGTREREAWAGPDTDSVAVAQVLRGGLGPEQGWGSWEGGRLSVRGSHQSWVGAPRLTPSVAGPLRELGWELPAAEQEWR